MTATDAAPQQDPLSPLSNRQAGLIVVGLFLIIGLWPTASSEPPIIWALAIAAGLFTFSMVSADVLEPLNKILTQAAPLLYNLVSSVVFVLVYFGCIILLRLVKHGRRQKAYDAGQPTYWVAHR